MIKTKHLPQRILIYCVGLFLIAVGVSLSINSNLGISPVNSVPYAVSLSTSIPLSTAVTVVFAFYMLLQILLLRKDYKIINLTQIFFATLLGYFVDFTNQWLGDIRFDNYIGQLFLMAVSIVVIATGVALYVDVKLVTMPSEGLALAITQKFKKLAFHQVKMIVDCCFVIAAMLITFFALGEIQGVREGTVISAVMVGKVIPLSRKLTSKITQRYKDL